MSSLTVDELRRVLSAAEPTTFSTCALRALIPKGKRQMPKGSLLEILEFISDVPPTHTFTDLDEFEQHIITANGNLGRRARDLRLPASWPRDGLYDKETVGKNIQISRRFKQGPPV